MPQQTEWFRHPREHMAIVTDDYFLFNPANALVHPRMPLTGDADVTFDWRALPRNIVIVTSFGISRGGEKKAACAYGPHSSNIAPFPRAIPPNAALRFDPGVLVAFGDFVAHALLRNAT